jgi:protein disulfide-isomerase
MKKIILIALFFVATVSVKAQDGLKWYSEINQAIEASRQEQKPLFLFFTGSDWCGWCMKLQNEVFKTPEFTAWAKDHAILVDLDFPRRTPQSDALKSQNNQLQQTFAVQGYPTVFFVNAKKTEKDKYDLSSLGKTGYVAGGPDKWIECANAMIQQK